MKNFIKKLKSQVIELQGVYIVYDSIHAKAKDGAAFIKWDMKNNGELHFLSNKVEFIKVSIEAGLFEIVTTIMKDELGLSQITDDEFITFSILHELGHYNDNINEEKMKKYDSELNNHNRNCNKLNLDRKERNKCYRQLPRERCADKWAIQTYKKYFIK